MIKKMSDKINLKKLEQNANKQLSRDGLTELLLGVIFLVSSAAYSGQHTFTPFLSLYVIYLRKIMEGFRTRFTYPRIGYVKVPEDDAKEIGLGILTFMGIVVVLLAIGLYLGYGEVTGSLFYKWVPLVIGCMLLGAFWYNYSKTGDRINLAYIVIGLSAGLVFSLMEFNVDKMGIQLYLLFLCGVFLISGVLRLYTFRRDNPVLLVEDVEVDE